ncbi:MAG: YggT family protein [Alphaproteobacteria bacterium]|nr:YggT family protein [Alphaproteobacteria bacterium]
MLNPFIDLLASVLHLYLICVIVWAVVSTLISFKIINGYQPLVQRIMVALDRLVLPALRPIQKYMPDLGGIDLSPIILMLLLNFTSNALYTYFYNW